MAAVSPPPPTGNKKIKAKRLGVSAVILFFFLSVIVGRSHCISQSGCPASFQIMNKHNIHQLDKNLLT